MSRKAIAKSEKERVLVYYKYMLKSVRAAFSRISNRLKKNNSEDLAVDTASIATRKIKIKKIAPKILLAVFGTTLLTFSVFLIRNKYLNLKYNRIFKRTIELPREALTEQLTPTQFNSLIKDITKTHPNKELIFGDISIPNPQDITVTQKGKEIPFGSTPPKGDVILTPSIFSKSSNVKGIKKERDDVPKYTCYDSDGGYNPNEKGSIIDNTDWPDSHDATDACFTEYGYDFGINNLFEHSCYRPNPAEHPEIYQIDESMGSIYTSYLTCENGCENGACIHCTDSDDGLNIHKLGHTVDIEKDAYTDWCDPYDLKTLTEYACAGIKRTDDPNILEWYEDEYRKYIRVKYDCPYGCINAKCKRICEETDEGMSLYNRGDLTFPDGTTIKDTCVDDQTLREVSCQAFDNSVKVENYEGYYTDVKCPQGTYCAEKNGYGYCEKYSDTVEKSKEGKITFHYTGFTSEDLNESELQDKLNKIKEYVEKYYDDYVEILGEPQGHEKGRDIYFIYSNPDDSSLFDYLPQYDTVLIDNTIHVSVALGLASTFYGDYYSLIPQTWRQGIILSATDIVFNKHPNDYNVFQDPLISSIRANYERFNTPQYPIWGANIDYEKDVFPLEYRYHTAAAAMMKVYQHNSEAFKNLNEELYKIDTDSKIWKDEKKVFEKVEDGFSPSAGSLEGDHTSGWYSKQHVLHQTDSNSSAISKMGGRGQVAIFPYRDNIEIYSYGLLVQDDSISFKPIGGREVTIEAKDDRNINVFSKTISVSSSGETTIPINEIQMDKSGRYKILGYPNENKNHLISSVFNSNLLHGTVTNFGSGTIEIKTDNGDVETIPIINGVFQSSKAYTGEIIGITIKTLDDRIAVMRYVGINAPGYFLVANSPIPSYSDYQPYGNDDTSCKLDLKDWLTYENASWKFKLKHPDGWETFGPIDYDYTPTFYFEDGEKLWYDQMYSTSSYEMYSAADTMELMDPQKKINVFTVTTSYFDFRNTPWHRDMFRDTNGKDLTPENILFKGIPVERYTQTQPMPAGKFYKEIYYFENKSIYYLIEIGIYLEDDVKNKNKRILNCLVNNFELTDPESSFPSEESGDLTGCSQNLYNKEWEDCSNEPTLNVCGYIRHLYETGELQVHSFDYRNPCEYCSQFDENGHKTLRGTKMYMMGYKEGACPK